MNGVLGTLQLLQQDVKDKSLLDLIKKATFSAKTLITIINDVLDYSKIEADQIELEAAPFSVGEMVASVESDLEQLAQSKQIYFRIDMPSDFNDSRIGDLVRVRQIILNLVSNAVKFTHEGGVSIKINQLSNQGEHAVRFDIIDTGIGMDEKEKAHVFERFVQADSSTTRKFGGTGLGLSISMSLVERMNGKLAVSSEKGKGTRVCLILPLPLAPETLNQINSAPSAPKLDDIHILIAEDNEINQTIIATMLEKTGAQLTFAENGKVAVERFSEGHFDCILMDIQMPEMDGLEAFSIIHAQHPSVPILALTANVMKDDITKYKEMGFRSHVGKPIETDKLYEALQQLFAA